MVTATRQTSPPMCRQPCCHQLNGSKWEDQQQANAHSEGSVNQGDKRVHGRSGSSVVSSLSLQGSGVGEDGDGEGVQELHAAQEE
ncbi:hypothetical protein ACQJBY_049882 [Aegilops geniculata]